MYIPHNSDPFTLHRSSVLTAMSYLVSYIHTETTTTPTTTTPTTTPITTATTTDKHNDEGSDDEEELAEYENTLLHSEEKEEKDNAASETRTGDPSSGTGTQLTRVRDSILDILIERTHDKNYYTRASVLKSWMALIESNSVPVRMYHTVCEIAVDRLNDKTAIVRKAAISMLTSLLENNPFGGHLALADYERMITDLNLTYDARIEVLKMHSTAYQTILKERREEEEETALKSAHHKKTCLSMIVEDEQEEEDDDVADEKSGTNDKVTNPDRFSTAALKAGTMLEQHKAFLQSEEVTSDNEVIDILTKLEYTRHTIAFITSISKCMVVIEEILFAKSVSDVVEALRFVTRAAHFKISGSARLLQRYVCMSVYSVECVYYYHCAYMSVYIALMLCICCI